MKHLIKNLLEVQHIDKLAEAPGAAQFQRWVDTVLADYQKATEIVIRIVDEKESSQLNELYRHKKGPTNVLSFPFQVPPGIEMDLLGDLVICASVVNQEARRQQKKTLDHWAHIVIHGVLHLLGFDHINDLDAERMEAKEIAILKQLNIDNPYQEVKHL